MTLADIFFTFLVRQDLQDCQDSILFHHFPDESDETKSASGRINTKTSYNLCRLISDPIEINLIFRLGRFSFFGFFRKPEKKYLKYPVNPV
jgi:hypothetical protein